MSLAPGSPEEVREVAAFLRELERADIRIAVRNGNLAAHVASGSLPNETRARIVALKPLFLRYLSEASLSITPIDHRAPARVPLNPLQEHAVLWSDPFPSLLTIEIAGPSSVSAVVEMVQRLLARHEMLSLEIVRDTQGLYQKIGAPPGLLPTIDLTEERDPKGEAFNLLADRARRGLPEGELVTIQIVRCTDNLHYLQIIMHHAVCDLWSMAVIVDDLQHFLCQTDAQVTPNDLGFLDYCAWHARFIDSSQVNLLVEQWAVRHRDIQGTTFPPDFPRPEGPLSARATEAREINGRALVGLRRLAERHSTTLFYILTAAFKIVLSKYAGTPEVCICTPLANRRPELENVVGCFVNVVPIYTSLSDAHDFIDVLDKVRASILDAYNLHAVSIHSLNSRLTKYRTEPIFGRVLINFFPLNWNSKRKQVNGGPVKVTPIIPIELGVTRPARSDLMLEIEEHDRQLKLRWLYSTALYRNPTMGRIADSFNELLGMIIRDNRMLLRELT